MTDDWCTSAGKRRYAKRKQARRAVKLASRGARASLVHYYCHDCGGYHLSSTSRTLLRKRRAM